MKCAVCGLELLGFVTCQECGHVNDSIDGLAEDALWENDIHRMVERFLAWEFPKDFSPDGGINFEPPSYPNHPFPTGTNLLDYEQAKKMLLEVVFNEGKYFKPNDKMRRGEQKLK